MATVFLTKSENKPQIGFNHIASMSAYCASLKEFLFSNEINDVSKEIEVTKEIRNTEQWLKEQTT